MRNTTYIFFTTLIPVGICPCLLGVIGRVICWSRTQLINLSHFMLMRHGGVWGLSQSVSWSRPEIDWYFEMEESRYL
jgi:hypothetical protein